MQNNKSKGRPRSSPTKLKDGVEPRRFDDFKVLLKKGPSPVLTVNQRNGEYMAKRAAVQRHKMPLYNPAKPPIASTKQVFAHVVAPENVQDNS